MPSPPGPITIRAALPTDYLSIAHVESAAFAHENFGALAFGPDRATPAGHARRVKFLSTPPKPGETPRLIIAVLTHADGREEVVGHAHWIICVGRTGSEEEKRRLGTREAWAAEAREEEEKKMSLARGEKGEEEFGNAQVRADFFARGGELLAAASGGRDYCELEILVVDPAYQRMGIGGMLVEEGLKIADEAGLQAILGASAYGLGLYKKHGFVETAVREMDLTKYEGGEGMGIDTSVFMHRAISSR